MRDRTTERIPATIKQTLVEQAQVKGGVYIKGDTLEPEQLPDDELDMEVLELSEDDDGPQDWLDEERPEFGSPGGVRPLWLLYGGQILWAADDIRFKTKELEFFRRRLQHLLGFLMDEFPSYRGRESGLVSALQGFFVKDRREKASGGDDSGEKKENGENGKANKKGKDRKSDPRGWTSHLSGVGLVLETGRLLPLSAFLAGRGTGEEIKGRTALPYGLLNLWLERELAEPLREVRDRAGWSFEHGKILNIKSLWQEMRQGRNGEELNRDASGKDILGRLNEFCAKVNDSCGAFTPETEEGEAKTKDAPFDLGFGTRRFGYNEEARTINNAINCWKALPSIKSFFEETKA